MEKIDWERFRRGAKQIEISGSVGSPDQYRERHKDIESAISMIQADPANAFLKGYIGQKNYAGFGDQGVSHEYGYGPSHGSVVFEIRRTSDARKNGIVLDSDAIYCLEVARDSWDISFPKHPFGRGDGWPYQPRNVFDLVRGMDEMQNGASLFAELLPIEADTNV